MKPDNTTASFEIDERAGNYRRITGDLASAFEELSEASNQATAAQIRLQKAVHVMNELKRKSDEMLAGLLGGGAP